MKPFLLLATRDHDQAATAEYRSVLRHTGLAPEQLLHRRVESEPLGPIDLADYSGILLGGSSFNISDAQKTANQQRVEAELAALVDRIVDADFPFLGLCYGVGTVTTHLGGVVDHSYAEPVGAIRVSQTAEAAGDPLLEGIPDVFDAFVGHKEACHGTPPGVTLLATGEDCPVQMYRVGSNVYVTQFHPELDADDLAARMRIYEHAGYFDPAELDDLITMAYASPVSGEQHKVLANFVRHYGG
ncbi:MAG: glutamine amidotransferase [Propionicimonas sp.]|uniref:glutamine amidotransferase n=1 Tax=Propionicimonas sp. TaxID=1955623 RepID=UPI002B1EEED2|nr:glutamine amidotransferase [Propionicimonas sp.]MEA4943996.1 glutamine amidotransferase [Propionicimonas sp.]MEA5054387.1 glutamine amidotransferase [Propionicimonas sp.]